MLSGIEPLVTLSQAELVVDVTVPDEVFVAVMRSPSPLYAYDDPVEGVDYFGNEHMSAQENP
jgi:hypothetical protein